MPIAGTYSIIYWSVLMVSEGGDGQPGASCSVRVWGCVEW